MQIYVSVQFIVLKKDVTSALPIRTHLRMYVLHCTRD